MANETITGKIFQLKDPSNSYNRFPRTVMEAVYGLNTYLQNQFSALSDIYMPIEGITESKPLQEFVYRACPSSIKAKSVSLDRIYGKTLAWNQLIQDSTPAQNTQMYGVQFTVNSDGTIKANGTNSSQSETAYFARNWYTIIQGHKYIAFGCPPGGSDSTYRIEEGSGGMFREYGEGVIYTAPNNNNIYVIFSVRPGATVSNLVFSINFVDLTLMGIADEISTPSDFFKLYPNRNYANNSGTLVSNDAESIETTGFNQWDEEVELGTYDRYTGEKQDYPNTVRCTNYVSVLPSTTYYYRKTQNDGGFYIFEYDEDKNLINYIDGSGSGGLLTTQSKTKYITFSFAGVTLSFIRDLDICINLSDPAKNGTYEPYRKSTMQLNLNSIKVKSHNIWDEEWEIGSYDSQGEKQTTIGNYIIPKNLIPVLPGTAYYSKTPNSAWIREYDANGIYLGVYCSTNTIFTTTNQTYFVTFELYGGAPWTTYNNDICINVSSSFNGQYEPHGDITITGGLKSAGSVRDEIVGNKYIKRVGSVDLGDLTWLYEEIPGHERMVTESLQGIIKPASLNGIIGNIICVNGVLSANDTYSHANYGFSVQAGSGVLHGYLRNMGTDPAAFKAAMSGVMLYYELATPVEYELVSPLVPTVKAGTTEARISPNSDGLSAPMVADMTYDAQANNDSASSQYALTAGRLLNSHKLWGQDSNNVGIGQSNPQYKLDVNGTFRATGNSTIGGTLAVTWNTTLNSDLTVYGDTFFHSDIYLYTNMALYLDEYGNNALYYDPTEGTIRFTFDYDSHFSDGIYSDSFITAGGVNASSDARLKDNLTAVSAEKALSVLMQLRPMEWVWNEKNAYLEGNIGAGLVAQEVESVLPFAVSHDTEYLSLNYNVFHAYEIASIQNHETRLEKAERRIEVLEAENAELRARLNN